MSTQVWAGIGGVAVAVVAGGLAAWAASRLQRRAEREARADLRAAAYGRYLVAQHVVGQLLQTVEPSDEAPEKARREHLLGRLRVDDANHVHWHESGAAEMHARLLAGPGMFEAIENFERFCDDRLRKKLADEDVAETWNERWKPEWDALMDAMREEQRRTRRIKSDGL